MVHNKVINNIIEQIFLDFIYSFFLIIYLLLFFLFDILFLFFFFIIYLLLFFYLISCFYFFSYFFYYYYNYFFLSAQKDEYIYFNFLTKMFLDESRELSVHRNTYSTVYSKENKINSNLLTYLKRFCWRFISFLKAMI